MPQQDNFFSTLLPRSINMDKIFNDLESMFSHKPSTFPPYNLVKIDQGHFIIEMAVAGFRKEDITVSLTKNTLTIKAEDNSKPYPSEQYVHRGIASRKFHQEWRVNDAYVETAKLEDGILKVVIKSNETTETSTNIPIV